MFVYINELLEKRISHGMDYFGKNKKIKKLKVFFFFSGKKFTYEINIGKCFPENFFKNATKHRKIFFGNYFTKIIFQKVFYGRTNRPVELNK